MRFGKENVKREELWITKGRSEGGQTWISDKEWKMEEKEGVYQRDKREENREKGRGRIRE